MTLTDYLSSEDYLKILIVRMKYIDSNGIQQTVYFSDKAVTVPVDLDSSTTMINPEPIIKGIPKFTRSFNPIDNEIVVKSSYSLNLNNEEGEWDDFFLDNIFTNQTVEFFITVGKKFGDAQFELLKPFEAKKIAEATIVEVSDISESISLKIKETNVFEKINTFKFEKFDQGVDEDTKKENKYAIGGALFNYKLTNINQCNTDDWWDYGINGRIVWSSSPGAEEVKSLLRVRDNDQASKLRNILKPGDKISFEGAGLDENGERREHEYLGYGYGNNNDFYISGLGFGDVFVDSKIYVKAEFGAVVNNKFLVSANKTKYQTTSKITGSLSARAISFTLVENWYFLQPGDILMLEDKYYDSPMGTGYEYDGRFYPVKVVSYNAATKVVTLNPIYCIPEFIATHYALDPNYIDVHYRYIRKMNIEGAPFYRDNHYSVIKCGGFDDIKTSSTKASLFLSNFGYGDLGESGLIFTADAAGFAANKDSIEYVEDVAYPNLPNITRSINSAGGYKWTVHIQNFAVIPASSDGMGGITPGYTTGTTLQQIKDAFTAWTTYPLPSFQGSISISAGNLPNWQYQKNASEEAFLSGGAVSNTNLQFATLIDPSASGARAPLDTYNRFCIYLQKNGVGTGPSIQYYTQDSINVVTGDTGTQVAYKLKTKINSYFPLFSNLYAEIHPTQSDTLILRKTIECNIPNQAYWASAKSDVWGTSNYDNYRIFEDIIENNEHIIQTDYIGICSAFDKTSQYSFNDEIQYFDVNSARTIYRRGAILDRGPLDQKYGQNFSVLRSTFENHIISQAEYEKTEESYEALQNNTSTRIYLKTTEGLAIGDLIRLPGNHITTIAAVSPDYYIDITLPYTGNVPNNATIYVFASIDKIFLVFTEENTTAGHKTKASNVVVPPVKIQADTNIFIDYMDENCSCGYLIKDILDNFFNITNYVQDDFDYFVDNDELRDNMWAYYRITESDKMFKIINPIIKSYNIVCFVDQSGKVRFKFMNAYAMGTADKVVFEQDTNSLKKSASDYMAQRVKFKYAQDFKLEKFKEVTYEDQDLTDLMSLTNFNAEKEVETVIAKNIFENTYETIPFKDHLSKKYFIKNQTLVLQTPITFINDELFTIYSILNHPRIDPNDQWILHKIDTNLSSMELTLIRLVPFVEMETYYLVTENDEALVDKDNNRILWT